MKIETQDTNIESLFTSSFLIIPRFQRPYSWDDENLEDFWRDVAQTEHADYFIGSMVIYKSGRQQFGVVDGQQRLTTITILLCAIRDAFRELKAEALSKGLHNLIERADRDSISSYVLKTETSYPFFQENIQKYESPEFETEPQKEELRLKFAYDFFLSKVSEVSQSVLLDPKISEEEKVPTQIERLKHLRDAVLFLKVIRVELDNEDDAYSIFETLNTRGKDLALVDLLKNHFTKLIKAKGDVDPVKEQWLQIMTLLNGSPVEIDPDTFFTHSWSSRYEAVTQQGAFKKIKSSVNAKTAKEHLNGFVQDSKLYRSIFDTQNQWVKKEKNIQESLDALRLFRVTQQTPAVLALVRAYRDEKIRNGSLTRALLAIENFHFLFTAVTSSRSSGGISAMYSSFGRRLFEAADSNSAGIVISDLIVKLDTKKPSLSEFMANFEAISYTKLNSKQGPLVRYILKRMSRHLGLAFTDDFNDLTIEHIRAQSRVGDGWDESNIGSIGNLIFLSSKQNAELSQDDFASKLPLYRTWATTVPQFVRDREEWPPEAARERLLSLAQIAYESIWTIV